MDQAKAVINLKEGVIQLEGPVKFVRKYLELYRAAVGEFGGAARGTLPTPKKKGPAQAAVPVRRRRGRAKRVFCADAIRAQVELGFFAEPKSTRELEKQLIDKGITCTNSAIRMNLKRLSDSGLLATLKEGRLVRYRRSG